MPQIEDLSQNEYTSSLVAFAQKRRREICKHSLFDRIKSFAEEAYYPTKTTTAVIVLGLLLLFVLLPPIMVYFFPATCKIISSYKLSKSDAIAVHSGVGAIIFALIIFVAEGLRDTGNKDRGRVYLKESFLYPLIVTALTTFAILVVSERHFANTVSVGFVLALTLISIYRLLRVCLSNGLFQKRRSDLLRSLIYNHVDRSVEQRLSINEFFSTLKSDSFKLQFHWDYGLSEEKFSRFTLSRNGIIADINLQKLSQAADLIDYYGNLEGKYYTSPADTEIREDLTSEEILQIPPELRPAEKDDQRYLHIKPGDEIEAGTAVLSVSKSLLKQESAISQIQDLIESAILVADREPIDFDLRLEFDATKKDLLRMLNTREPESFKDAFVSYLDLIEGFSHRLGKCGGRQDYAEALKENGSFYSEGWEELNWIREDLKLFIDCGFAYFEDEKIRDTVLGIPTRVSSIGLKNSDHLIFQQGINLFMYSLGHFLHDQDRTKFGRVFEFFESFFKYNLQRRIHSSKFQGGRDNTDLGFFNYSIQSLAGLIKNLARSQYWQETDNAIKLFKNTFDKQEKNRGLFHSPSIPDNIESPESRVLQISFGFSAWLTRKMFESDSFAAEYAPRRDQFAKNLPRDFSSLLTLFLQVHDQKVESFWGWDHWDVEATGIVYTISPSSLIREYGVPKLLELITQSDITSPKNISIFIESGTHPIEFDDIIADLSNHLERYQRIFPELTEERVNLFESFLANVKQEKNRLESERLRSSATSKKKKDEFIENFYKAYLKNTTARKLLEFYGKISDEGLHKEKRNDNRYGFNQLDEKAAFIEDWPSSYSGWWENYATGMAQGEDEFITMEFKKRASNIVESSIESLESTLSHIDISEHSVIFLGSQQFLKLYKLPYFRHASRIKESKWPIKHIVGYLEINGILVPTYLVRSSLSSQELLIVDLLKCPSFVQLPPAISTDKFPMVLYKHFGYLLEAYSENDSLMEDMLENPPDWLKEKGSIENMREYLEEKILIRIYENIYLPETPDLNFVSLIHVEKESGSTDLPENEE